MGVCGQLGGHGAAAAVFVVLVEEDEEFESEEVVLGFESAVEDVAPVEFDDGLLEPDEDFDDSDRESLR